MEIRKSISVLLLSARHVALWSAVIVLAGCTNHPDVDANKEELYGGIPAFAGQFDSTVLLLNGCTATVVSQHHLLTAAHCVVVPGTTVVRSDYRSGQTLYFTNQKIYAATLPLFQAGLQRATIGATYLSDRWQQACALGCQFTSDVDLGDIAVVQTVEPIHAIPAAQIDRSLVLLGSPLTIAGYGCDGTDSSFAQLRNSSTYAMPHSGAWTLIATPGPRRYPLAAGLCEGDSGGPVYRGGSDRHVVGVHSYRHGEHAESASYNVHTAVYPNLPWLNRILPSSSFYDGFSVAAPEPAACEDTCYWTNDGVCDDGGLGSLYSVCDWGTDCDDCGAR